MRRLFALASVLLLSACMRAPREEVAQPAPAPPAPQVRGELNGLTPNELVGHFGKPALQIREGSSLKLQFRGRQCVLDAYLYPQNNVLRVTHVDTRTLAGYDSDQAACIASLE